MTRECRVVHLGRCDYREACSLQKQLLRLRIENKIPDTLVLLQHPPVFTIGRKGSRKNILVSAEVLNREGIPVCDTDRGGDVTYHGPGQIVGYPILDLNRHGKDVHRVINLYEEVVIRLLKGYGIQGCRVPEYPGVWVGNEKICAIGIGVSNWVTFHGFAINVNTNMDHFSFITPCGISGKGVTSMERILGGKMDESVVAGELVRIFGHVFDLEMK
ncbi:MAG: lipoyl(octanoyl) transferase LipB [Bacillota bacterium]